MSLRAFALAALLALGAGWAGAEDQGALPSPVADPGLTSGVASWYGADFQGRPTSSGEIYDKELYTAAHKSLPFGTLLLVRSLDTGASVVVKVNDRGPFKPGRVLDLSEAAARVIGLTASGTGQVTFQVLGAAEAAAYGVPPSGGPVKAPAGAAVVGAGSPAAAGATARSGGALPPGSASTCRIQVASYKDRRNAEATLDRLRLSGISGSLEAAPPYTRVVLLGVKAGEAEALAERLRSMGYRSLLITWY